MMNYYVFAIMCLAAASQAVPQKRLAGGTDVSTNENEWVGSLQRKVCGKWVHVCGCAVLFGVVDTAAHCFPESANIDDYRVVYRTNDLTSNSATIIPLLSSTRHPQFAENGPGFSFDFISFDITSQSSGVTVLDPVQYAGEQCEIYGWRRTSGSSEPSLLHTVNVTTIAVADCKALVNFVQATISGRDTCVEGNFISEGDGGNPLVCLGFIRGLASWSTVTANGGYVTIFTAGENYIGKIVDWVDAVSRRYKCPPFTGQYQVTRGSTDDGVTTGQPLVIKLTIEDEYTALPGSTRTCVTVILL